MSTPVVNHEIPDDPRNDPDHPFPNLNVIDVSGYLKGGGADLSIIVASPLQADERSKTRLLDKIQGYLGHMQSDEFAADAGAPPSPDNTRITILLHPDSSGEILELLDRCRPWVLSHGATLVVRDLADGEPRGP
jgi:hypothetical protein